MIHREWIYCTNDVKKMEWFVIICIWRYNDIFSVRFNAVLKRGKERESGNVSLAWKRGAWRNRQTAINAGGENRYWNRSPFHVRTITMSPLAAPHRALNINPRSCSHYPDPHCSSELHQLPYISLHLPRYHQNSSALRSEILEILSALLIPSLSSYPKIQFHWR